MKNNYWWRVGVLLFGMIGFLIGVGTFYPYKYGLCNINIGNCMFVPLKRVFSEPLSIFSVFFLIVSSLLFFISDKIFLRWLRFAIYWAGLAVFFVIVSPVHSGGFVSLSPTKESVSIWMGILFVIISVIMFIVLAIRERGDVK